MAYQLIDVFTEEFYPASVKFPGLSILRILIFLQNILKDLDFFRFFRASNKMTTGLKKTNIDYPNDDIRMKLK